MARPSKKNADYFPHDKNMRNGRKVQAVRKKFGPEGYAVYCMLLEVIADCDDFTIEIDEIEIELLAGDFGVDSEILNRMFEYFLKLDMIQGLGNNRFGCEKLVHDLTPLLEKRENMRRKRAKKEMKKSDTNGVSEEETDTNEVCATQTPHSKVKYSKAEYSKEKGNTNSPSPQEEKENPENPLNPKKDAGKEKNSAKKEKEYSPEAASDEILEYYEQHSGTKQAIINRVMFRETEKMTFKGEIYALCCENADNEYWKKGYMDQLSKVVPMWLKRASEYSKSGKTRGSTKRKTRTKNFSKWDKDKLPAHYK